MAINPNYRFVSSPKFWDDSCHKYPTPETRCIDAMLNALRDLSFIVPDSESMPEAKHRRDIRRGKGTERFYENERNGLYTEENIGVKGEIAFSRLTGLPMQWRRNVLSDGGIDFNFPLADVRKTLDVKSFRKPLNLLLKPKDMEHLADYYVLAGVLGDLVTLLGWATKEVMQQTPTKVFNADYKYASNYLPVESLQPMATLLALIKPTP